MDTVMIPDGSCARVCSGSPEQPSADAVGARIAAKITDQLSIRTTHKERPLITIPIAGTIRGDLQVIPPSAFFGFVKRGQEATSKLSLTTRSDAPFKLLDITPSDPNIKVTQAEIEGGYRLTISVPTDKLGVFDAEVVLTTDIPLEETIKIPVYAHVLQK